MRRPIRISTLVTCLSVFASILSAQTNTTWTGTDGVWSDATNWNNGVPVGQFNAVIPGSAGNVTQDLPDLGISGLELAGEFAELVLDEELSVADSFTWNGGTISGNEAINLMGQGAVQNGRLNTTLNNFGSIVFSQGTVFSPTGDGTWNNQPGSMTVFTESTVLGSSANQIGRLNNANGATVRQLGGAASYMIWDVVNDGLIEIENNSQLLFVHEYIQRESGILHLKGANSIADMFGLSQIEGRIVGEGQVISTIELDGVMAPGQPDPFDPIGSLQVFGNLTMMPDSILELDIGVDVDSIAVSHNVTLDGIINLTAREGLVPGTYTLITAGQQLIPGGLKIGLLPTGVDASLFVDEINRQVNLVVVSVETSVGVDSVEVTKGIIRSGGVPDLLESDDGDLSIARNSVQVQSVVELTTKGVTSIQSPRSLSFTLEASVFARGNINQTIELYNFESEAFEIVDTRLSSRFLDQVTTVDAVGDLSRFVQVGTGCVEARINFNSIENRQQFSANIDQIVWLLE